MYVRPQIGTTDEDDRKALLKRTLIIAGVCVSVVVVAVIGLVVAFSGSSADTPAVTDHSLTHITDSSVSINTAESNPAIEEAYVSKVRSTIMNNWKIILPAGIGILVLLTVAIVLAWFLYKKNSEDNLKALEEEHRQASLMEEVQTTQKKKMNIMWAVGTVLLVNLVLCVCIVLVNVLHWRVNLGVSKWICLFLVAFIFQQSFFILLAWACHYIIKCIGDKSSASPLHWVYKVISILVLILQLFFLLCCSPVLFLSFYMDNQNLTTPFKVSWRNWKRIEFI